MTQYLSRRERREAERQGVIPEVAQSTPAPEVVQPEVVTVTPEVVQVAATPPAAEPVFLSRRERRLAEQSVSVASTTTVSEPPSAAPEPRIEPEIISPSEMTVQPFPEVAIELEPADVELPAAEFTGANLLAEPNTHSIVLDIAPEAISLPLETGEILTTTGSIEILPETAPGTISTGLDGIELDEADRADAVTGVISIVEPVSALDVIHQRATVGVVPGEVLRRGWWQPWAYGALGVALVVATILAAITILEVAAGR